MFFNLLSLKIYISEYNQQNVLFGLYIENFLSLAPLGKNSHFWLFRTENLCPFIQKWPDDGALSHCLTYIISGVVCEDVCHEGRGEEEGLYDETRPSSHLTHRCLTAVSLQLELLMSTGHHPPVLLNLKEIKNINYRSTVLEIWSDSLIWSELIEKKILIYVLSVVIRVCWKQRRVKMRPFWYFF